MELSKVKMAILVSGGFLMGLAAANLPRAIAESSPTSVDMSTKKFRVSIDEIHQNFVFGDEFAGSYKRQVTMSDGSVRTIELTPMIHDGKKVVEFKDSGGHTYMGPGGTTTNGKLMVQLRDIEQVNAQLQANGWRN